MVKEHPFGRTNGGDEALKITFPRLFAISEAKQLSIREVWDESNESWNLKFCRNLKEEEIGECILFHQNLSPFQPIDRNDGWIWNMEYGQV